MPDIWTHHPEIVRDLLREAGFTCGVEPRILKGRDPDWTCIVDGKRIAGDIYIHQAEAGIACGVSSSSSRSRYATGESRYACCAA